MTSFPQAKPHPLSDEVSRALLLVVLFVAIYSLTFSGTFITDDEHILASRALSLAFDSSPNDDRVYGNDRLRALAALPGEQGLQAVNIEPGQIVLGAALARFAERFDLGRTPALFSLNIWVTALTAAVVFLAVRVQKHRMSVAIVCAALFALGSSAWPYSRTYFRDPLATFWLSVAWLGALILRVRSSSFRALLPGIALLSVGFAAGVLTKNTIVLAAPSLFGVLLLRDSRFKQSPRDESIRRWRWIAAIVVAFVLWFAIAALVPQLARFTSGYYSFLAQFFFSAPHPNLGQALSGPFVSPGKSIFLYSPVLLISLAGIISHWRTVWPAWLFVLLLVTGQALFYDASWWGQINWGLRFMLPAIPLLLISSAPVIATMLRSRIGGWGLVGIALVSGSVQLIGVLVPVKAYYIDMARLGYEAFGTLGIWSASHSALLWHWRWLARGGLPELASLRVGLNALPFVTTLGVLGIFATWAIVVRATRGTAFLGVIFAFGVSVLLVRVYSIDPVHTAQRDDLDAAFEHLNNDLQLDDVQVIKAYGLPVWKYWMNRAGAGMKWYSLPFSFPNTHSLDTPTLNLFEELAISGPVRMWLVVDSAAPGANERHERVWLEGRAQSSESWRFEGARGYTDLYLFTFEP